MKKDADASTLLIGYGNPLREDDALGVVVAEHFSDHPKFTVRTAHQLLPEMAEEIARFDRIIFVDVSALVPAGVLAVPLEQPPTGFNHILYPHTLMGYARRFFGAKGSFMVFSCGGESFEYKKGLTPKVQTSAQALIEMIERLV